MAALSQKEFYALPKDERLIAAALEGDSQRFIEALDLGANPNATDESANPAWETVILHPDISDGDRAVMLEGLFDAGFVCKKKYIFEIMAEEIEDRSFVACARALFRIHEEKPGAIPENEFEAGTSGNWWQAIRAEKDANKIDKSTAIINQTRRKTRL